MNSSSSPCIYGINVEIGDLISVDKISESADFSDSISELNERGVDTFSELSAPVHTLLIKSILKTLEDSGLENKDIDGVMIVTESYSEITNPSDQENISHFRSGRNLVFELLAELGLDEARLFSSTYGGSGNFINAMLLADSIVQAGKVRNLLMVCFDCLSDRSYRFIKNAIAISGDGVSTFIYGYNKRCFPFHVINHINVTSFLKVERCSNMGEKMLEMYRCTKSAAADCFESTGNEPDSYSWLILNNYNRTTNRIFGTLLGFPPERIWMKNVAATGHIASCDSIINLSDIVASGRMKNGANTLVFVNSPIACGTISLTTFLNGEEGP